MARSCMRGSFTHPFIPSFRQLIPLHFYRAVYSRAFQELQSEEAWTRSRETGPEHPEEAFRLSLFTPVLSQEFLLKVFGKHW